MRSSQSIMQCEIDATIYFSVLSSPHLPIANQLKPSEVTVETATTVQPYFTLDLRIKKRFYIENKQLQT